MSRRRNQGNATDQRIEEIKSEDLSNGRSMMSRIHIKNTIVENGDGRPMEEFHWTHQALLQEEEEEKLNFSKLMALLNGR
jgi:hypothetical protein